MKQINMKYLISACLTCILQMMFFAAHAQVNPMAALYFQNQYLGNPAMAGTNGLDLSMGFRKQWTSLPGTPSMQSITADYALTSRAGLGVKVYNERSGLFKSTRTVGSYAYHLPLSATGSTLSFGLSMGFMNDRISNEDINGSGYDPSVANYNQRDTYIDGDFGMAYTDGKLNVQTALPNMKSVFKKDLVQGFVGQPAFFSAISYKFDAGGPTGIGIEPKVVYRGINGQNNILDVGANLTYAERVSLFGMYHTSQSASYGLGMTYQSISFSGIYTTSTAALSPYNNGNFEIALKAHIF